MGEGTQSVTALGLSFSLCMAVLLLLLPRRYALVPIIVLVCYMTMGERIVIMGLNFTMIRILLVFGWLRLLIKGEVYRMRWSAVDKLIIWWTIVRTINYTLVWGTTAALVNRLGYAYDIIGAYFLFRFLIRDREDVYHAIRYLAMFIGPVALLLVVERMTARNVFAVFGGVSPVSAIRGGVLRCQGPFGHSILAGTFGATTLPLFIGMKLFKRASVALSVMAIISATLIVMMCGSSGPVLAYAFGLLGFGLWPIRRKMTVFRWSMVLLLVLLQCVMNRPVWFLIGGLTVFSGSTGWYRGFLIDMAIRHLDEWWLIGTNANASWHSYLADVTNQYLLEGFSGGLLGMGLFIAILTLSFRSIGRTVRSDRSDGKCKRFAWALGAALVTHAVSFISVSYFDQNFILFYLLLAAIPAVGSLPLVTLPVAHTRSAVQDSVSAFPMFARVP